MAKSAPQANGPMVTPVSAPHVAPMHATLALPKIGLHRTNSAPIQPINTNFGTINGARLLSPVQHPDVQYLMGGMMMVSPHPMLHSGRFTMLSPMNNIAFGSQLTQMGHMFETQNKLPIVPPAHMIHQSGIHGMAGMQFQPIPVPAQPMTTLNIPNFNVLPPSIKEESELENTTRTNSKRGRKRKIKQEDDAEDYHPSGSDDFVVNNGKTKKRARRGRKKIKDENDSLQQMLYQNTRTSDTPAFVGIRNEFGEVQIAIPPRNPIKYEVFGFACTERIEDILQPKGRTRYVRGLSDKEKKDRRREQNRNAAARSRARKNAMIAKVIQLHQENLGLRAFISSSIREKKELEEEKAKLMEST